MGHDPLRQQGRGRRGRMVKWYHAGALAPELRVRLPAPAIMIPMPKWFAIVVVVGHFIWDTLTNPWFWISGLASVVTYLLFWR